MREAASTEGQIQLFDVLPPAVWDRGTELRRWLVENTVHTQTHGVLVTDALQHRSSVSQAKSAKQSQPRGLSCVTLFASHFANGHHVFPPLLNAKVT